jgi:hypothetical protein
MLGPTVGQEQFRAELVSGVGDVAALLKSRVGFLAETLFQCADTLKQKNTFLICTSMSALSSAILQCQSQLLEVSIGIRRHSPST